MSLCLAFSVSSIFFSFVLHAWGKKEKAMTDEWGVGRNGTKISYSIPRSTSGMAVSIPEETVTLPSSDFFPRACR